MLIRALRLDDGRSTDPLDYPGRIGPVGRKLWATLQSDGKTLPPMVVAFNPTAQVLYFWNRVRRVELCEGRLRILDGPTPLPKPERGIRHRDDRPVRMQDAAWQEAVDRFRSRPAVDLEKLLRQIEGDAGDRPGQPPRPRG